MSAKVVLRKSGELSVEGPVTIGNVVSLVAQGSALFDHDHLVVDLEGVSEVDSSAVSMLLEWQREAGRRGNRVCFVNMPPNLQALVRLYGVSGLIRLDLTTADLQD